MALHSIDIVIIFAYLILTVVMGFLVSRRASKDLDSYFLGGKILPWYILGISNASGQFGITGTMWLMYLCFVYRLKSVWIAWVLVWRNADKRQNYVAFPGAPTVENFKAFEAGPLTLFMEELPQMYK